MLSLHSQHPEECFPGESKAAALGEEERSDSQTPGPQSWLLGNADWPALIFMVATKLREVKVLQQLGGVSKEFLSSLRTWQWESVCLGVSVECLGVGSLSSTGTVCERSSLWRGSNSWVFPWTPHPGTQWMDTGDGISLSLSCG